MATTLCDILEAGIMDLKVCELLTILELSRVESLHRRFKISGHSWAQCAKLNLHSTFTFERPLEAEPCTKLKFLLSKLCSLPACSPNTPVPIYDLRQGEQLVQKVDTLKKLDTKGTVVIGNMKFVKDDQLAKQIVKKCSGGAVARGAANANVYTSSSLMIKLESGIVLAVQFAFCGDSALLVRARVQHGKSNTIIRLNFHTVSSTMLVRVKDQDIRADDCWAQACGLCSGVGLQHRGNAQLAKAICAGLLCVFNVAPVENDRAIQDSTQIHALSLDRVRW